MESILACPVCKKRLTGMSCQSCGIQFQSTEVPSFICEGMYPSQEAYEDARRIIDFWGNGWRKRLTEPDHAFMFELDQAGLRTHAEAALTEARSTRTLMGVEVPLDSLRGKIALNIGCGAGGEALLLTHAGAHCIAMDITAPAAGAAQTLMRRLGGDGIGIQADARFIPLEDASVDLVYSSGVLHHSPDILRSIGEVFRVLKPGGMACIMLYATWSITFLQEKLLRWPGEQAWETEGRTNPCTTTYSRRQCRDMFSMFDEVAVRQAGGSLRHIAKVGRFMPTTFDGLIDGPLGANVNIRAIKKA